MATTDNSTLPKEWNETTFYEYGQTVLYHDIIYKCIAEESTGDNPALDNGQHWYAIDIYRKTATVMHGGDYSGDTSIWERDIFWVDQTTGDVYCNNENTGINVKGPAGSLHLNWDQLTPAQIAQLKGDKGDQGLTGPQGEKGDKGDTGEVELDNLTQEQIEMLRGEQGASAYDVWKSMPGHEEGTEEDFINDITGPPIKVDDEMSSTSTNPVQNKVIYDFLKRYNTLFDRVQSLEDRLKYKIDDPLNPSADEDGYVTYEFKFGVTNEGEFGFIDPDTGEVVPFNQPRQPILYSTLAQTAGQIFMGQIAKDIADVQQMNKLTIPADNSHSVTTNLSTDNVSYATGVRMMNLDEAFDARYYIFKEGEFERYQASFNFFRVGFVGKKLISQGTQPIEGSWTGTDTGGYASNLCFVVQPVTEGTTIQCSYGAHNSSTATLPEIVNGAGRVSKTDATFNTLTTFTIPIAQGQGGYFASVNGSPQFEIVEIYMI